MAKLITPKVATALHTASVFVNSQIAKMHSTVQATNDKEIIMKLNNLTNLGLIMPFLPSIEFSSFCNIGNKCTYFEIEICLGPKADF